MKVTIKKGAHVGQDLAQKTWPLARIADSDTVFELVNETRFADFIRADSLPFKCVAPGFGGKPYGNGALYVKAEDLVAVEDSGEAVADDVLPCHFTGGTMDGLWVDLPKNIKHYVLSDGAGGEKTYERNGNGHCFYLKAVEKECSECKHSSLCKECGKQLDGAFCLMCDDEHSCFEPKAVQDVKVLASHDASSP